MNVKALLLAERTEIAVLMRGAEIAVAEDRRASGPPKILCRRITSPKTDVSIVVRARNLPATPDPDSIIVLVDTPYRLSAISGRRVAHLDQKRPASAFAVARVLRRAMRLTPGRCVPSQQDQDEVHHLMNAGPKLASFIQEFSAVIYSVTGDEVRNRIKSAFIAWICSDDAPDALRDMMVAKSGKKRAGKRVTALSDFFTTKEGQACRTATRLAIAATANTGSADFDGLSKKYDVGNFDLRYMAYLSQKRSMGPAAMIYGRRHSTVQAREMGARRPRAPCHA